MQFHSNIQVIHSSQILESDKIPAWILLSAVFMLIWCLHEKRVEVESLTLMNKAISRKVVAFAFSQKTTLYFTRKDP